MPHCTVGFPKKGPNGRLGRYMDARGHRIHSSRTYHGPQAQIQMKPESMKALSIRQPWAWLVVNGHKDIENRSWRTTFRGRVLIHAGKQLCPHDYLNAWEMAKDLGITIPKQGELQFGGIVGEATIIDCVQKHPSHWFFGDYGFVLKDQMTREFLPCRGALGFFAPSPSPKESA